MLHSPTEYNPVKRQITQDNIVVHFQLYNDNDVLSRNDVDMSYYRTGVEKLISLKRFNDQGNIESRTPMYVDEMYFRDLYIDFVMEYGVDIFKQYPRMKLLRKLDSGTFGDIYSIKFQNQVYIIKLEIRKHLYTEEQFRKKIRNEVRIQQRLSRASNKIYALHVYDHNIYKYMDTVYSVILMERMREGFQYTLGDLLNIPNLPKNIYEILYTKLNELIRVLCKLNIIHGDMHLNNIFITYIPDDYSRPANIADWKSRQIRIGLIDFGYSAIARCNIEIELLALLKSIYNYKYSDKTFKYMKKLIYIILQKYDINIRHIRDILSIHKRYNDLFQKNILYTLQ